jgi:hypothetical protein
MQSLQMRDASSSFQVFLENSAFPFINRHKAQAQCVIIEISRVGAGVGSGWGTGVGSGSAAFSTGSMVRSSVDPSVTSASSPRGSWR